MSKTTRIISRLLFLAYIGLLAYLCFGHFNNIPDIARKFHLFGIEQDKLVHFCMFFPFPILCYYAFGKTFKSFGGALSFTVVVFLLGCCLGAATEIGQGMTTYRSADPKDFFADGLSLAISSVTAFIICLIHKARSNA